MAAGMKALIQTFTDLIDADMRPYDSILRAEQRSLNGG
jgi:hypothetical protein